jgi:hypothetical protein
LKNLIEKRSALIAEFDKIKQNLESEKRTAYSNEEREAVNKIKIEISDIDSRIADEREIEEKRNSKLDFLSKERPSLVTKDTDIYSEFRSFANGGNSQYVQDGKFQMPFEVLKRSTITTSSNSNYNYVDQKVGVSVNDSDLVLAKLGVTPFYFESGSVDHVSMSEISATFGTEDSTVSDATLTTASKRLNPAFVSASIEVSKKWLAQSKPENIQALVAELNLSINRAVEKRTIDTFSTLTAIASGATGVSTTFVNAAVLMEAAINGAPTGYIFYKDYFAKGKVSKQDAGSGLFAIMNGQMNGMPVIRATSSLMTNTTHAYLIDKNAVAMAYWGTGISVEIIQDATLARKGNVLLIASALADGSYIDANKVAIIKNANRLS